MTDKPQRSFVRLLRWSEKYTKTDMVYLASGGIWSVISQISSIAASLVLAIVVSHFLSKATYGEYKYVLSVIAILSSFSLVGIGSAVLQSTANGFDGSLQRGFWTNIRWSFFIFVGAIAIASYYFTLHNPRIAAEILIGGCLAPLLGSSSLFLAFLAGKRDFVRQQVYAILDNVIPVGALIVTVFLTNNPLILVAVYFVANLLADLYFYFRTTKVYKPDPQKIDTGMVSYGKHLSVMGILGGIADNLDQILVFHYIGAVELAIYNFAAAIPDQIKGPLKTFDAMVQAGFVKRTKKEIESTMGNKFLWFFIFSVIVTVAYILSAPFIFTFLFPKYIGAIGYSQVYALWLLTLTLDPANSYLTAKKKIKEQYIAYSVYSVLQIGLMFLGIIFWGLIGLIVARIITRIIVAILNYFLYKNTLDKEIIYV